MADLIAPGFIPGIQEFHIVFVSAAIAVKSTTPYRQPRNRLVRCLVSEPDNSASRPIKSV